MSTKVYIAVFSILVGVTAAELLLIGYQGLSRTLTTTTLIGLAGFKAILVAGFFQHLKDEPRPLSTLMVTGLVIAMALISISFLQLHPPHT